MLICSKLRKIDLLSVLILMNAMRMNAWFSRFFRMKKLLFFSNENRWISIKCIKGWMLHTSLKNVQNVQNVCSFEMLNLVGIMTETLFTAMQMVFVLRTTDYPMNVGSFVVVSDVFKCKWYCYYKLVLQYLFHCFLEYFLFCFGYKYENCYHLHANKHKVKIKYLL